MKAKVSKIGMSRNDKGIVEYKGKAHLVGDSEWQDALALVGEEFALGGVKMGALDKVVVDTNVGQFSFTTGKRGFARKLATLLKEDEVLVLSCELQFTTESPKVVDWFEGDAELDVDGAQRQLLDPPPARPRAVKKGAPSGGVH